MIVLIEKNANNKLEFTKEELEELLEKARQEGVKEGQKTNYIYTRSANPSPLLPNNRYVSPFTCGTPQTISDSTSIGTTIKVNGAESNSGI